VLVPEFGRLPVGAIAPALADQLQVAVEALKARRAQRRRHLALQPGLRVIVGAARGFRDGERSHPFILLLLTGGHTRAQQRNAGKRDQRKSQRVTVPTVQRPTSHEFLLKMQFPFLAILLHGRWTVEPYALRSGS